MSAYYNEHDPFAAAWLRELIKRNLINVGEVDERSIEVVQPDDLRGFTQCHFFAGIGVWSYALRRAGWDDARPVWTGSCPCQPFSAAGKGEGFEDKRHLWPHLFRLIQECRPGVCFGEQVASPDGLAWLDLVSTDLEGADYAFAAADLCAASVGAPHIRQRLWWVADTDDDGRGRRGQSESRAEVRSIQPSGSCPVGLVGHANEARSQGRVERGNGADELPAGASGVASGMADADGGNAGAEREQRGGQQRFIAADGRSGELEHASSDGREQRRAEPGRRGVASGRGEGPWSDTEWLPCSDGKARAIEPGSFPLVDGAPARVGRLRGYGNAIVAEVAETFIASYLDVRGGLT